MKIYVATSWRNEWQPGVVVALRESGHEVYDFREPHTTGPNRGRQGVGFRWSEIDPQWESWTPSQYIQALNSQAATDGFGSDMDALEWCEACVLVMPCGRSAHLEAGWAKGIGKLTLALLTDYSEPELMYRMFDKLCLNLDDVIHTLGETLA